MTEKSGKHPTAFIMHRDGMFVGAIAASLGNVSKKQADRWKRQVAKFCGDGIADGFNITPVHSAKEYGEFTKDMPLWKRPAKESPNDLFSNDDRCDESKSSDSE